jgi:hypothetical protein
MVFGLLAEMEAAVAHGRLLDREALAGGYARVMNR